MDTKRAASVLTGLSVVKFDVPINRDPLKQGNRT